MFTVDLKVGMLLPGSNHFLIKIIVKYDGKQKQVDVYFESLDAQMAPEAYKENNKTLKPAAARERWTLSFCTVIHSKVLIDSPVLENCDELESVVDVT